jgi:hypothetical protein
MRREDDPVIIDPVSVRFRAVLFVVKFRDRCFLEDMAPLPGNRRRDRREIFSRMKLPLVRETHAGRLHLRNALQIGGVKTEFIREGRILAEAFALVLRSAVDGRVEITGNPGELALDRFLPHQLFDLVDGCGASIPGRLSVIPSEIFHHLVQTQVHDIREMRRGMPGIDRRQTGSLHDRDRHSSFF